MNEIEFIRTLSHAIRRGDVSQVESLIARDFGKLHIMTPLGAPLHLAASRGQLEVVKLLVGLGADINQRGEPEGATPLTLSAGKGHLEIVRYLVECGAEYDMSESERNPLIRAIIGRHTDVARFLIARGIDIHVKYGQNMDALTFAENWGMTEVAELLRALGAGQEDSRGT